MLIFACCHQVAAFLVGVMRGKFGKEDSQPQQAVGGGNGASPREEHRNLRSTRVQVAGRSVDQTYWMQATKHA